MKRKGTSLIKESSTKKSEARRKNSRNQRIRNRQRVALGTKKKDVIEKATAEKSFKIKNAIQKILK